MSARLSRSEREFIVGSYLKGKPVAGYDVIECANGKYRVKAKPFEVESSDEPEPESVQQESVKQEPESEESSDEPQPVKQPRPKQRMSKQDARQLLKQLNDMFSDDDDEPQSYSQQPRNWNRRRLKF